MSTEINTLSLWVKSSLVFSQHSSVIDLIQTYQEWLNENPDGYVS